MSTVTNQKPTAGNADEQRDQLEQAEKNANPNQFREENEEEKIVEIPPIDKDGKPIRGLDP